MSTVGVCSWSLQPRDARDLVDKVNACGLSAVQLALSPIQRGQWDEAATRAALRDAGVTILSGMMQTTGEDYSSLESIRRTGGLRPDEHWQANLAVAWSIAAIAGRMGLDLVTFHAGFIPHDATDPERARLLERLGTIADIFAQRGIRLGLETGQESADTLGAALRDLAHPNVGVNFDPANMILYGMGDPVTALRTLTPRVVQVHIKDAVPTAVPGTWGKETAVRAGAVDWPAFLAVVREKLPGVNLLIEREAGGSRPQDIRSAAALVTAAL
jgi:L-ribulose-5-phosphate 3-epimerase